MNLNLVNRLVAVAAIALSIAAPSTRGAAVTPPDQPVLLIDTSASAGSVVASSSSSATYSADHAFDGNWADNAGRWLAYTNPDNDYGSGVHGETPMYLVYRFNAATKVNVLRLRIQNANEWDKRSPKAWTFLGSNDNVNWTTLDTRSGVTWASGTTVKTFAFENETKYEYYKFNCTEILGENNYLQIYEIQFLYNAGIVLTDLTTSSSGGVSDSSATLDGYPGANAFDGLRSASGHRWLANVGADMYVTYRFNEPTAVNLLGVFNAGAGAWSYDTRAPKDWTFQASNDGTIWTTLDTQTGETGWGEGEVRYYSFKNNARYTYYKYSCTANNGQSDYLQLWELEFYFLNQDGPALGNVSLARTGALAYSLSATEDANAADLAWIANNGSTATTNGWVTVAEGGTANWTISDLATNTTYEISALATNENGTAEATAGTLYTGMLMFDASSATDAYEYGSVTGGVVVARATGDPFPLTVNYTISGSAGTEGTTWAAPVAVTIPANSASATLPVTPLIDGDVAEDVTITVSLAQGNYELPASNSATLTLVNLAAPAGKKTWVAAADGLASDGANWSPSGAPTSSDSILFDDNFSNARCTWDAAATHSVASWEQTADFTGTVELQTTYDTGAFPALAISGNFTVNGGTITQTANSNAQTYRLSVTVGSNLVVAAGAKITATGKGYSSGNFPAGSACGVHGGSVNNLSNVYGDLKHPVDIGSGGASANMTGGGAVHILVTGDATVDGTVASQPSQGSNGNAHGAGGSIYLQAASLGGNGEITAAGYGSGGWTLRPDGAGGRVAVVLTSATTLDFPVAQLRCNGTTAGYTRSSGGGTIFVKTALQQNGTLYVVNNFDNFVSATYWPTKRGVTPIPAGQTWTLDEIHFRGTGVLCVPEGTTLNVPLSGISASSERTAGILYEGGTIDFGTAPYALSDNWVFQADQPYTFDGDVTVSGGASLGCLRFSGSILDGSDQNGAKWDDYAVCDVVVDGNLTIAADGYASGDLGGPCGNAGIGGLGDGNDFYPRHGGQYATHSGNRCYGSVFDPVLPGQFGQVGDHATISPGGGAIKLTVTGDFVVNGKVQANGERRDGNAAAAAGSINIRARTLSGSGTIKAYGLAAANIPWAKRAQGAGGRIAVRVTGEEVGTTGVWTSFTAVGCTTNTTTNVYWNRNTSAGTIYLQGKSDGEKGGTIYVRNQKNYDTSNVATWIPAAERGDSAADFANAKLVIADRGVVAIGAAKMKLAELTIEDNSRLDLHGEYVRVKRATVGGTRLAGGKYTAATLSQFLADSGKGGVLDVGGGFFVIIR